jgi:hypothetical protein
MKRTPASDPSDDGGKQHAPGAMASAHGDPVRIPLEIPLGQSAPIRITPVGPVGRERPPMWRFSHSEIERLTALDAIAGDPEMIRRLKAAAGALPADSVVDFTFDECGQLTAAELVVLSLPSGSPSSATRPARRTFIQVPSPSPQSLTGAAVFLAGKKRRAVNDEWKSHLFGWPGRGLCRRDQVHAAWGFLWSAMRYRLQDAADLAWRPVDAVLSSRTLSNLFVWVPVIVTLVAIVRHDGLFGLVADDQDPVALGAFLYCVIKAGRWWRGVKPPEPKARRVKE